MKNKRNKIQKRKDQIKIRDFLIKELVNIIIKNKIELPIKLFDLIKNLYKIELSSEK
jgi:hypothetical protein